MFDGIIGMDFLSQYNFKINLDTEYIELEERENMEPLKW